MSGVTHGFLGINSSRLRIGAVLPHLEIGGTAADLRAFGEGVAALGFDHILAYDHVLGGSIDHYPKLKGRYTSTSSFHEVMVALGFLAAVAPSLELVTGVLILPQRQTALVAKQAAELDIVTDGKFRLGVGIGWNDIEYAALSESFRNRAKRMEEQIDVLRQLWTADVITFTGAYHQIDHAGILPVPVQRPIPIWIGAGVEAGLRRAARLADGFIANESSIEDATSLLAILRDELEAVGKSPADFGMEPRIGVAGRTEADWRKTVGWWRDQGASHVTIGTMNADLRGVERHLDALARVKQAITDL